MSTRNPHPILSQSTATSTQHPNGHVERVILMHTWVRVSCLCSHCPSTISSSLWVKNNWETPSQPGSICSPSPSASFGSLVCRDVCVCRAWRSTSSCYTCKPFQTNPLTCYFLHTWLLELTLLFPALVSQWENTTAVLLHKWWETWYFKLA